MDMGFSHWMALESAMRGERSRRRFTRETLGRIYAFARPHRRALVGFLLLSVVSRLPAVRRQLAWRLSGLVYRPS